MAEAEFGAGWLGSLSARMGLGFDEDQVIGWMQQPDGLALDPGDVVQPGGTRLGEDEQPVISGLGRQQWGVSA